MNWQQPWRGCSFSPSYLRAAKNLHVKNEASLKKCKMVVLVFQHHNSETAKLLSPTADAVPIDKDRLQQTLLITPHPQSKLELSSVHRNSLTEQHWFQNQGSILAGNASCCNHVWFKDLAKINWQKGIPLDSSTFHPGPCFTRKTWWFWWFKQWAF